MNVVALPQFWWNGDVRRLRSVSMLEIPAGMYVIEEQ